jgi:Rad52/22 family double-strand break repair protein
MNPYYCPDPPPSGPQHANLDSILSKMAQESSVIAATPTAVAEAIDSWNQNHFRGSHIIGAAAGQLHSIFPAHTNPPLDLVPNPSSSFDAPLPRPPPMTEETNEYVRNLFDHSIICDRQGRPVTVARMLSTKPLASDLQTRPGPGGKKLVYLSGDTVTRLLNEIFGHSGWNLQILKTEQVLCVNTKAPPTVASVSEHPSKTNPSGTAAPPAAFHNHVAPMWHVAYLSHARITICRSGSFREDLGAGDAMDRNLGTAIQHAIKASITDAMKRAARHLGDKLGNSLYQGTFRVANAPKTLLDALDATVGDPKKQPCNQSVHSNKTTASVPPNTVPPPPPQSTVPSTSASTVAPSKRDPALNTTCSAPVPVAPSILNKQNLKNGNGPLIHTATMSSATHPSLGVRPLVPPITAAEGLHKAMLLQPQPPPTGTHQEVFLPPAVPTHRPRTSTGRSKSITPPLIAEAAPMEAPPAKKSKMSNPYSS